MECFFRDGSGKETEEKSKPKQEEMKETASSETPYEYVIVNDNGYLTVYQKDLKTVYFRLIFRMRNYTPNCRKRSIRAT